ncbi:sugar kinase [candidate division WOR-1 bacterium RIFOXYB2_FULL_42_35]|uniref:Sugar kinase n=1 Tax=candidate division WOR-1 bacterium RIFOXYC2_FULL_41_25 TaxID=1802586 RepID=A0A1F4TKE7_UNCSA|nr:MAG: sugar kinase [candidate division WOR-1 bacterium RIFOXYA2_FULL_41_14]OGC22733.1 MAG: sugar kinase [candidate division WOR-1 bacterium RIFOXYB2_FULL_42_35]OGC33154.1 MAG: sugar kinase [candidate division WOR-1 bacterium RIFOXYC2_FULL_41_25]OGC43554.1 MAG: sugar kinase [candidate division WOR-1 bacterium RIFOXYD2_FULL_41_8]
MSVLVVGTIALDTVQTPFGEKKDILGGSGVYAATAASFFGPAAIVGVVGSDFPQEHLEYLKSRKINTESIQTMAGETFRWSGYYEYDMNQAHTKDTRLNVLLSFDPKLTAEQKKSDYVFLANLDPELQLKVLDQLEEPKLIAMDTMDFWINSKREALKKVISRVDIVLINDAEARQFMETPNLPVAAAKIIKLGAKAVIIKKGEHGALLFSEGVHFSAPSYPQEMLRDPTGAGDSFAGGFMGYLAKTDDRSEKNIRRAIIMGSVLASFNVEDFSLERMRRLQPSEISTRFNEFKKFSEFEILEVKI